MASFKRILVATALSDNSLDALQRAVDLAADTGSELYILNVCEPISEDARITFMSFMQDEKARDQALSKRLVHMGQRLKELLDGFWARQDKDHAAVRKRVVRIKVAEGYPAEEILRRAVDNDCDLIVLGAHEQGIVSHNFLGSVTKRVLRRSRLPVLVVPFEDD